MTIAPVRQQLSAGEANERFGVGQQAAYALEQKLQRQYEASLLATGRRCVGAYRARTQVLTAATPPKPEGDPQNPSQPPQPTVDEVLDGPLAAASAEARTLATRRRVSAAVAGEILSGFEAIPELRPLLEPLVRRQAGVQAERLVAGTRDAVANVLLDALVEGWSVDDTAKYLGAVLKEQAKWRATMLARTDLIALSNGAAQDAVLVLGDAGPQFKTWVTAGDERVREDHQLADRQTVGVGEPFNVGGAMLQYPGDPLGPDSEIINCRCAHVFSDTATPVLRHSFEGGNLMSDQLAVAASGWDESKHPRDPGGEGGGRWIPKGVAAIAIAGEKPDHPPLWGNPDQPYYAGVWESEWDTFATSGLFDEAIRGELKAGELDAFGNAIDATDVKQYTESAQRIEKAAQANAVINNDPDSQHGELYRGMSFENEAAMKEAFGFRKEYVTPPLTSTTTNPLYSDLYAKQGMEDADVADLEGVPVVLRLQSKDNKHRGIQTAPMGVPSNEVVLPAGERYRVSSKLTKRPDGVWEVGLYRASELPAEVPTVHVLPSAKPGPVFPGRGKVRQVGEMRASAALDVLLASFDPSKHPHKPRGAGGGQWARAAQVAREAAADGVTMDVTETDGVLKLNKIVSQHPGEGHASEALDDLVEYANAAGKPVFLNPSALGGLTQEQLIAWYRRHGFRPVGKGMEHSLNAAAVEAIMPFLLAAAQNPGSA